MSKDNGEGAQAPNEGNLGPEDNYGYDESNSDDDQEEDDNQDDE